MAIRRLILAGVLVLFGWLAVSKLSGPTEPLESAAAQGQGPVATAELAEDIVDGRIAAQLFVAADLSYRLDIQFAPAENSSLSAATRPSVSFAMQEEHMDGIEPPLQLISNGQWRATGQLPKPGKWIVNVGVGDDFAEADFEAK